MELFLVGAMGLSLISLIVSLIVFRQARRGFIQSFERKFGRKPTLREELFWHP